MYESKLSLINDSHTLFPGTMPTFCAQRSYCDFVVWTKEDIHVERIYPNESFWVENVSKVKHFFVSSVLPELVGKFFSWASNVSSKQLDRSDESAASSSDNANLEKVYCYCRRPEEGAMVGCDNHSCPYEWFHLTCLKLTSMPKSKYWYCPDCRQLSDFRRKRSGKHSY